MGVGVGVYMWVDGWVRMQVPEHVHVLCIERKILSVFFFSCLSTFKQRVRLHNTWFCCV